MSWRAVHIEDAELIALARAGDIAACEAIVRRYQDVAIRTAHVVSPEADADDAVQEAFLKAFDALPRFRDGAPLRPWLLRIVANEARNRRRSAGRRQGLAARAAAISGDEVRGHVPGPEEAVMAAESRSELLGALATLRDDDREILGARFLLDLSEAENRRDPRSAAGHRQVPHVPRPRAVGRTSDVTGDITIEGDASGARLTAGSLNVDTTTIASDEGRRDDRLRTEGLETDRFPTATFVVTSSADIPAVAIDGTPTDLTLVGELTLHGVTRPVEIPAQARLTDGRIQVAGSLTFSLADFDVTAPNVGGFIVSIADEATLEFLVSFSPG